MLKMDVKNKCRCSYGELIIQSSVSALSKRFNLTQKQLACNFIVGRHIVFVQLRCINSNYLNVFESTFVNIISQSWWKEKAKKKLF